MPTRHAGRLFCPLRSLYAATPALAATVESLVTDVRYIVNMFPIIYRSMFKRCALLS